jgi:hypothetical protein
VSNFRQTRHCVEKQSCYRPGLGRAGWARLVKASARPVRSFPLAGRFSFETYASRNASQEAVPVLRVLGEAVIQVIVILEFRRPQKLTKAELYAPTTRRRIGQEPAIIVTTGYSRIGLRRVAR